METESGFVVARGWGRGRWGMIAKMEGDVVWGVMKYSVIRWCWRLHNFVIILETTELYIFKSLENKLKKKKIHQNGILVERHPLVLKVI